MTIYDDARRLDSWKNRAKGDRTNAQQIWQDIADNELGSREFTTQRTPHQIRSEGIYDTTAMFGNQMLAGANHGMLTNPVSEWFEMQPANLMLMADKEVSVWLDDARRKMQQLIRTQASNFATQVAEQYLDITGFGTSCLSVMPHKSGRGVSYSSHPLAELYLLVDEERQVDVRFRELPLTARQYARRFPDDNHPGVVRALESHNPESQFTVSQCIGPSDDPYAGKSPFSAKPFTSVYWTTEGNMPRVLDGKGFDENPLLTPRWSVEPGDTYGRCPGWIALPEAKMLNQMSRTILVSAQKAADPPLLITNEAVLSGIRTFPGGTNIVQQLFGQGGAAEPIRHSRTTRTTSFRWRCSNSASRPFATPSFRISSSCSKIRA